MARKIGKDEPKIRANYNPQGKELDVLKHVYKRYYDIKDGPARNDLVAKWDKWMKNWEGWRPEKKADEWQSNHFAPLTTSVVESILSEMVDQSPRPIILPRSSEDTSKATVMQHIFNFTWEIADGDLELFKWLHDTLIFGTGMVQEYYWQDRRIVKLPKKINKDKIEYEETEVLDYDDCYMENVSLYDIFVDEKAREVNRGPYKARDIIRRYVMDIDSFHDFFSGEVWDPLGNAKQIVPGGDTNFYEFYKPPETMDKGSDIEVLWYWARRPEDILVVVANDVVVKFGPNPYRHKQLPFAKAVDVTRPHQFYCKGEPELLESVQDEMNTFRRMMLDRGKLDIDKMFLVSNRETFDERDLVARPHGIIPVDDPKSVKAVDYGDIPRSVQVTMEELNKDSIKVTGIEDRFQSVRTPATATDAAIQKESVLRRVRMKLRHFEKGSLIDVGRQRVANILQFYTQPKLERIIGESGSSSYRQKISLARREGRLSVQDGVPYEERYPEIRIPGKRLVPNEKGEIREESIRGISFFETRPEDFMPMAQGGFDIRFEAGSTMPVSKPLLQTKVMEMFDRIMPIADIVGYDMTKLTDRYVETLEFDPQDFKKMEEEGKTEEGRQGNIVEMALVENEMFLKGEEIPENGTPYATPSHTEIHISLIRSPKLEPRSERFRVFLKHILGEIMAQEKRREEGVVSEGKMPTPPPAEGVGSAPKFDKMMKDVQPTKVQGGGEVPEQPPSRGLLAGVKNFFRGGT